MGGFRSLPLPGWLWLSHDDDTYDAYANNTQDPEGCQDGPVVAEGADHGMRYPCCLDHQATAL